VVLARRRLIPATTAR
jgi:ABC-type Mn2+/Zn2+ transport system permease subunit